MKSRTESGNQLVELTLSLALLTSLFLGVWQFGYAFYNYAKLEQAVRDGARYASIAKYDSATTTPSSSFQTAVQNVVVYGDPAPLSGAVAVAPGLTTSNIALTVAFTSGVPSDMSVAIKNYRLPAYFGSVTLNNKPLTWFHYMGTFGPP